MVFTNIKLLFFQHFYKTALQNLDVDLDPNEGHRGNGGLHHASFNYYASMGILFYTDGRLVIHSYTERQKYGGTITKYYERVHACF